MKNRRGFTMVEILVAIVIIAILAGILMVGLRSIGAGVKERATQVTLQNLVSMLEEYRLTGKGDDIDRVVNSSLGTVVAPLLGDSDKSDVSEGVFGRDYLHTLHTAKIMRMLYSIPGNRQAMENVPSSQLYTPKFIDQVIDLATGYQRGDVIEHNGVIYRATANNTTSTPPAGNWEVATSGAPVFLDAYGNPIIYVHRDGLDIGDGRIITSPDGSGFFVSAGLDGKLGGDVDGDPIGGARDNIYSFDQ